MRHGVNRIELERWIEHISYFNSECIDKGSCFDDGMV
jgi:hypothetical protein